MRLLLAWLLILSTVILDTDITAAEIDLPASECSFAGTFVQEKSLDGLPQPLSSKGAFYYHCRHGVIWSTNEPVQEALILNRAGNGLVVQQNQTKKLNSRQSKFLGNLLNSLMGGDSDTIEQQFEIEQAEANARQYQLKPRKRSLKRGIKQLMVSLPEDDRLNIDEVVIEIVDRNSQATEIRSKRTVTFEIDDAPFIQCGATRGIDDTLCQQLFTD